MKKLALFSVFALLLFSCGNQKSKTQEQTKSVEVAESEAIVVSVDQLYEKAEELADKEIVVKGTVFHICTHGGQRCFIMGSNEDINIRIEAGEKIGAFSQELMGSEIEVVGILREVKTEADAHNPGQHDEAEHSEGEHAEELAETEHAEGEHAGEHSEDAEVDKAHDIISESQEAAEIVYFIEGLKSKEL
jgi:hypothetical protein